MSNTKPLESDAVGDDGRFRPDTCLPAWGDAELPEPKRLGLKNLAGFIGPGIVMCGVQLAGGEWLLGAEITAKYGGGLMWIALVAIIGQVFYNIECGRYALYCGEPVFTAFFVLRNNLVYLPKPLRPGLASPNRHDLLRTLLPWLRHPRLLPETTLADPQLPLSIQLTLPPSPPSTLYPHPLGRDR